MAYPQWQSKCHSDVVLLNGNKNLSKVKYYCSHCHQPCISVNSKSM